MKIRNIKYLHFEQINTYGITDSISPLVTAIALDKMNVFYIGVDNPVTIAVSGVNPEELIVKIYPGTIQGKNGKYIVHVDKPGNTVIEIYKIEGNHKTLISKSNFRSKRIPDPVNGKIPWDMDLKVLLKK